LHIGELQLQLHVNSWWSITVTITLKELN